MPHRKLQQEIGKRLPFDSLEQEAILNILRTSDLYHNQFGRLFREFDVTPSQYNVLRILRGEGKPMPSLEIADRMLQVVPAITGLIDRLQAQDLVKRKRCTEDRRVVYIEITSKALSLLNTMDEPELNLHRKLIGHLSAEELTVLSRVLEKARTSLSTEN
jgi:MarR family transcriptional regulator, 2-MHQ and catechol-resistance regulon repressor